MLFCHDSWMGSQFAKKTSREKDTKKCEKKKREERVFLVVPHIVLHMEYIRKK